MDNDDNFAFEHETMGCIDLPALVLLPQKYKSSGGLFGWLLRDRSISSPLDFPLSDVNLPSPLPDYVEPSKTKISTLPNGVRVASETSPVHPCAPIDLVFSKSVYVHPYN